jgi:hypothetical protein
MPFLTKEDLNTVIRDYELETITEGEDTIVDEAIEAAIDEVASILTPNDMKLWQDGRPHYDVVAIFNATGTERNALMLTHTKSVAMWHLVQLCNTGLIYKDAVDRYDRAIEYLNRLAAGKVNSRTLPKVAPPTVEEPEEQTEPFRMGSNKKFNHYY